MDRHNALMLRNYLLVLKRYARKAHQLCGEVAAASFTPVPWPVNDMDVEDTEE